MPTDWASIEIGARAVLREQVLRLLHDWIKYMEMRLLSIDWQAPPANLDDRLQRAIRRTRHRGDDVRGIRSIWMLSRAELAPIMAAPVIELVAQLEADVVALEALTSVGASAHPKTTEALVRAPGRRLRQVRDELGDLEEAQTRRSSKRGSEVDNEQSI